MKSFLQEYGFAILAAIVVIIIIAMCTPIGNVIRNQISGVIETFSEKTSSKLSSVTTEGNEVVIIQNEGSFTVSVTANSSTDSFRVRYKKKSSGEDFNNIPWVEFQDKLSTPDSKVNEKSYSICGEVGEKVMFQIINEGTDSVVFESQAFRIKLKVATCSLVKASEEPKQEESKVKDNEDGSQTIEGGGSTSGEITTKDNETYYSVAVNVSEGGSVNCKPNSTKINGQITCTATANEGYSLDSSNSKCDGSACFGTSNSHTFSFNTGTSGLNHSMNVVFTKN